MKPFIFLTAACLFALLHSVAMAQNFEIVTEDLPPYQFKQGGQISGMATEVVRAVLEESGLNAPIRMFPWARAFKLAQTRQNIVIYSIARTPEREKQFQWIGQTTPYRVYFWKLRGRDDVVINQLDDAKKYKMGGVYKDVKTDYLVNNKGFEPGKHVDVVSRDDLNIKKLVRGRIDYTPYHEVGFAHKIQELGYSMDLFEKAFGFSEGPLAEDLYKAASLTTDPTIIKRLAAGIDAVKANGTYERIKRKYLGQTVASAGN